MLFFAKLDVMPLRRYSSLLNLLRTKCLPVLLYGVEACPLGRYDSVYLTCWKKLTVASLIHHTEQTKI